MADIGLRARLDLKTFTVQVQEYNKAVQDMVKANTAAATASTTGAADAEKASQKLIKSWTSQSKTAQSSSGSIVQSIRNIISEMFNLGDKSEESAKQSTRAWDDFRFSWNRVKEIVSGVFVIDVFRTISNAIKDMAREAVSAVSDFQRLQIQLQALAAIDYAKEFGGEVVDAFDKVLPKAKELMGWIREIAVTTPFSVETIAQAVAYGQAFGFTVEQSKRLSIATGNFTAGMGLTNEQLERILYNFGQMLASGRILGRELRDLANNFVPVTTIIQRMADEAGVSFNEMRENMKKGLVPAGDFIAEFVEVAEERFPDAMERMSRTIAGVQQNFKDFIHTVLGLELLGPTAERFAGVMADVIQKALSPQVLRTFSAMGFAIRNSLTAVASAVTSQLLPAIVDFMEVLGLSVPSAMDFASAILSIGYVLKAVVNGMASAVKAISNITMNIISKLAIPFTRLREWGFEWGANFIMSFAEGMARAIAYVISVITAIANAIRGMLESHSPPKILPRLGLWGRNAMLEYLKGWGSADFSILNDVFSTLSSYVRSLAFKMEPIDIARTLINVRKEVIKAVQEIRKFGAVTSKTLKNIGNLTQLGSGAVREYIKSILEVATITAKIENIDKILDFKEGVPTNIFGTVVDSIEELIKVASKVPGELGDAVKKYVQALADTKYYDELIKSLEDRLTALTDVADEEERIKAITEALASGLLTEQEASKLAREKEAILIKQRIRTLEGERDTAKEVLNDQKDIIQNIAKEELRLAQERLDIAKSTIEVLTENNNLLSEYMRLLESLKKAGSGGGAVEGIDLDLDFEGIEEDMQAAVDDMEASLEEAIAALELTIQARIDAFIAAMLSPFTRAAEIIGPYLDPFFASLESAFDAFLTGGAWQAIVDAVNAFYLDIQISFANIRQFFELQGPELTKIAQDFVSGIGKAFGVELDVESLGESAFAGILGSITGLGDSLVQLTSDLVLNGPIITEAIRGFADYIVNTAIPNMKEAWKWFTEEAIPGISDFVSFLVTNGPTILTVLQGMLAVFLAFKTITFVGSLLATLGQNILFISIALNALNTIVPTVLGLLGSGGLVGVLGSLLTALGPIALIVGIVIGLFALWNTNFMGFRDLVISVVDSVKGALAPAFEEVGAAFAELKDTLKVLIPVWNILSIGLKTVISFVVELVKVVVMLAGALITGLVRGFLLAWKTAMNAVSGIVKGLTVAIKGIIDFFTGFFSLLKGIFTGNTQLIVDSIRFMAAGVTEFFFGMVHAIWNAIVLVFGNILVFIGGFITGVIEFFRNLADKLINNSVITDMLSDIWDAFVDWLGRILEGVRQWMLDTIAAIVGKVAEWLQAGQDLVVSLWEGLKEKFLGPGGVVESVGTWIGNTIEKIREFLTRFVETGAELISNLITGAYNLFFDPTEGLIPKFLSWIQETIDKLTNQENIQKWIDLGKSMISGMIKGLQEKASLLWEEVKKIIAGALGAGEKEAGVGSPAEEWVPLGKSLIDGILVGFKSGFPAARDAIKGYLGELSSMPTGISSMNLSAGLPTVPGLNYSIGGMGRGAQTVNIDRSTNISMNPSYANYQSEASVRYDLSAVLAIAGL